LSEPDNGYRFKRIGRLFRRPSATNGESILRRDEESACAHKLGDPQLPRKASVELTADVTPPDCRPAVGVFGLPKARAIGVALAVDAPCGAAMKFNSHRAAG
jgi:hypothetical protein